MVAHSTATVLYRTNPHLDARIRAAECAELIGRTVHATEALLVRARRAFKKEYPTREGRTS